MGLTKRILFTLFVLVIYRIGLWIPLPGIDPAILLYIDQSGPFFESVIDRFSPFTLGIWPYISAYIVLWLLKMMVPSLRKRSIFSDPNMDRYVRYGTIVICIIQSIGLLIFFRSNIIHEPNYSNEIHAFNPDELTLSFTLIFILVATSGTLFLVWLADQITKRGVGNGVLLMLFAGFAGELLDFKELFNNDEMNRSTALIILLAFFLMMALVIARQFFARHIPVEASNGHSKITFKVHPINDILIISLASWFILIPSELINLFNLNNPILIGIVNALSPGSLFYFLVFVILMTLIGNFTYRAIYYNSRAITDQLDQEGRMIPGINSGEATRAYFIKILSRIVLPASIILAIIAIYPDLLMEWISIRYRIASMMGGINIIVAVGVALSVAQSIQRRRESRSQAS